MIITCEKCNTSFELDENLVKEAGSKVRCTNCDNVFIAKPQARSPKQEDSLDLSGLEMVLDMDAGKQKAPDLAPSEKEPELELELSMDMEKEEAGSEPKADDESEGIDLSDIEKMLEMDGFEEAAEEKEEEEGLKLELADEPKKAEAIDLTDLEKILEMEAVGGPAPKLEREEEELTLELETESAPAATGRPAKTGIKEEALELDLKLEMDEGETLDLEMKEPETLELSLDEEEPEMAEAAVPSKEADIDLDFKLEEPEDVKAKAPEPVKPVVRPVVEKAEEPKFAIGEEAKEPEEAEALPKKVQPAFTPSFPLPKRRVGVPAIILIILIILGVGAGGYYYMSQKGIAPFGKKAAGEILPDETSFKYKFVENANIGTLFILTGIVENKFDHTRSNVSVTGELLSDQGAVIKTKTVFCGNIISDQDLASGDLNTIEKHLMNAQGDNGSNTNIKAGAKIPFMVVFSDLPENISEYRVQIAGSVPAEK
jgi:predicted Zn finger-like uncharacterized protein